MCQTVIERSNTLNIQHKTNVAGYTEARLICEAHTASCVAHLKLSARSSTVALTLKQTHEVLLGVPRSVHTMQWLT